MRNHESVTPFMKLKNLNLGQNGIANFTVICFLNSRNCRYHLLRKCILMIVPEVR